MKKRTSKPLLRASMAAVGTALLACAGPGNADKPGSPDEEVQPFEPIEHAATRVLKIVVVPPAYFQPKEPAVLTLADLNGRVLATRTLTLDVAAAGSSSLDWAIPEGIDLPREVRVSIVVPADDDPVSPSANDLSATVTGVVGEPMALVAAIHLPVREVTVVGVPSPSRRARELRDPPPPPGPPVYANTKGSHHYQALDAAPPPVPVPTVVAIIEVEGPPDRDLMGMNLRVVGPDPDADELHGIVGVGRFPSEIRVMAMPGQVVPDRFQLILTSGEPVGKAHTAVVDALLGGRVRAVLREP